MRAVLRPRPLRGVVAAIPSKSAAHRLLIASALSQGPTLVTPRLSGEDTAATVACLRALGAEICAGAEGLRVTPLDRAALQGASPVLDCGESGSTLRFLLPVAAALGARGTFVGRGRLPLRPLGPLAEAMRSGGADLSAETLPLTLEGRLAAGTYPLPGNVSSQFVTGLLLALPLLAGDSEIRLTTALESADYVNITLDVLACFGIRAQRRGGGFLVPGGQKYQTPGRVTVEGDWSNAAFFLALGALSGPVSVTGLDPASPQGDKEIVNLLRGMGAQVAVTEAGVSVSPGALHGAEMDVSHVPDLLPVLAAVAACARGVSHFTGAGRLRLKESDRIAAVAAMIRALGGEAREEPAGLLVEGRGVPLAGGVVDGRGDHRIVMSAAVLAPCCTGEVTIEGAEAVNKSYPGFFAVYNGLGGEANVV